LFILAITEVNTHLAWAYFKGEKREFIAFCKQLAHALVYNQYTERDTVANVSRGRKRQLVDHELMKAPLYAWRWTGSEWDVTTKNKYQQDICNTPGCKSQVHTFCKCSPGTWMCASSCLLDHVVDGVKANLSGH
jgi:hypothetical protein